MCSLNHLPFLVHCTCSDLPALSPSSHLLCLLHDGSSRLCGLIEECFTYLALAQPGSVCNVGLFRRLFI